MLCLICKLRPVQVLNLPCLDYCLCINCHLQRSSEMFDFWENCHKCHARICRFRFEAQVWCQKQVKLALDSMYFLIKEDGISFRSMDEMIIDVDSDYWDFYEICPFYSKIQLKQFI